MQYQTDIKDKASGSCKFIVHFCIIHIICTLYSLHPPAKCTKHTTASSPFALGPYGADAAPMRTA
jgi:hypothetical protein